MSLTIDYIRKIVSSFSRHAGLIPRLHSTVSVTFAAVAIFGYAWLVPIGVWAVLTWRGNTSGYSFLEIICVYGYSLSIFIPISVCTARSVSHLTSSKIPYHFRALEQATLLTTGSGYSKFGFNFIHWIVNFSDFLKEPVDQSD